MHLLYLTKLAEGRATTMRAIRNAQRVLVPGQEPASIDGCRAILDSLAEDGAALLGGTDDAEAAQAALGILTDSGCAGYVEADAEGQEEPPEPAGESGEEDEPPTYEAAQVAMVMLVMGDGNPASALAACNSLHMVTDDDLYVEAATFLLDTFPLRTVPASLPPGFTGLFGAPS